MNGDKGEFSIETDEGRWNGIDRQCADVFLEGTTAPNLPFSNPEWVASAQLDGMTFASEIHGADTDGDGVPDGWEVEDGSNPLAVDTDGDGLTDGEEREFGSSPALADTDGDGLLDPEEQRLGTFPDVADTDGDGLTDWEEVGLVRVLETNSWVRADAYVFAVARSDGDALGEGAWTAPLPRPFALGGAVYDRTIWQMSAASPSAPPASPTDWYATTARSFESHRPTRMDGLIPRTGSGRSSRSPQEGATLVSG